MKASVVIPLKNGGALFRRVLRAVRDQLTPWPYEILVIDSGSTDGEPAFCDAEGIRVHRIAAADFGHGRSRNLGVSLTTGDFIAFLTHDALPASDHWLADLVAAADSAPDVAGAFGRHLPYPEADPYTARDLRQHFDGFRSGPSIVKLTDRGRYDRDLDYRRSLHFFSDNNACIRRSVWARHPYPDVDFAEDQIWAKTVLEAGYAKAYADTAAVYHSHTYSVLEAARRSFDESAAFKRLFDDDLSASGLFREAARAAVRDIAYSKRQGRMADDWRWMLRAPAYRLARQIGYFAGARADRLSAWLQNRLSHDAGLKAGRRVQPR